MEENFKIRVLVMDVDGTLTDGGIYMGNEGEVFKRFHVKDGYGIHNILPQLGIIPVVLTGRNSSIVEVRCRELGIEHVIQGSRDKTAALCVILDKLGVGLTETAYIGDDLNDYDVMMKVGLRGCPHDAAQEIKNMADFVSEADGGEGAVREFIEWIRKACLYDRERSRCTI